MQPRIIITRPRAEGLRFAKALHAVLGEAAPIVIAPAFKIEPLAFEVPSNGVVFTSRHAVTQAARAKLTGLRAWCVGDKTAQAATRAGFDARSANGTADDLVDLILASGETGPLTHIRGAHTRGDIAARLTAGGCPCDAVIAYDQTPVPLPAEVRAMIEGADRVIIPLFSPRTTALVLDKVVLGPQITLVAISSAAAGGHDAEIAKTPDAKGMIDATVAAFCA